MIIAKHLPVVQGRPPSWAWCLDPDWRALAARAVTAPAWAGPKGVPCFGRPTLDCRCTTCRAGRPYLRDSLHLLQGALAVEPAYTLAMRVGAAGEVVGYFLISLSILGRVAKRSNSRGSRCSNSASVFSNWVSWSFKGKNSDAHIISSSLCVLSFLFLLTFLSAASTILLCFLCTSKICRKITSLFLRISDTFEIFSNSNRVASRSTLVLSSAYCAIPKSYFVFSRSYVSCLTMLCSEPHQSPAPMPPRKMRTANPIVRTFWRFAAFFRCLHVVIVCTPDLPSHHRSSVIYSSLIDYRQKPVETLDTDLTASITNGVSLLHTK